MSEDFPRPQDPSNTESNDSAVSGATDGESSHQPDVQPYPQARYNTGEYRHREPQNAGSPSPAPAQSDDAGHTANVANESASVMNENDQNTGPLGTDPQSSQSTAAVWQPRPSGALASEAWASPTPAR